MLYFNSNLGATLKIATIDAPDASKLGRVPAAQVRLVTEKIVQELGVA